MAFNPTESYKDRYFAKFTDHTVVIYDDITPIKYIQFRNKVLGIFWLPQTPVLGVIHKHKDKITFLDSDGSIMDIVSKDYVMNSLSIINNTSLNKKHNSKRSNIIAKIIMSRY
jgi:hypothetical protein